jgi:uncharacterized repeat protein (TIGR01451 family)
MPMKKLFLLLFILCFQFIPVKAQYVTIPDANFVTWLTQQYPSCMNGNQMDTTCTQITSDNSVNVSYYSISDLTGIQYFDNLQILNCSHNQLIYLSALPSLLIDFNCSYNQLSSLPQLPDSMINLHIDFNNILCLYNLPTYVQDSVFISNNPFTCVPNQSNFASGYPLCINNDPVNNPNNCLSTLDISGFIYSDQNSNCAYDPSDLGSNNIQVQLYNSQNTLIAQNYSSNGTYGFTLNQTGTYKVKLVSNNMAFSMTCAQADSQIVNLISLTNGISNVNFPVQCNQAYDVNVQSVNTYGWVFPGQIHTLNSNISNNETWYNIDCNAANFSGTVTIEVTGPVTYTTPAANALIPQVNGNIFTYTISDFNSLTPASFGLKFQTDTTAQANDQICVHINISTTPVDADTTNNIYDFCYNVLNSYDPNMKEVYPINVLPGYDDWFTYTIHFQNTGNAPAFNIRLKDTLDNKLNLNTFEILGFSHEAITSFSGNILTVRFNNIMLPDSTTDYEGSMGYFQYRIKPLSNLPNGTQIENTAYIYFDYNAPIITNTTQNNFDITLGKLEPIARENEYILYPNPSNGVFNFKDTKNLKQVEVYNILGEEILAQGNQKQINLSGFAKGIYYARINGEVVVKLVKE